MHVNRKRIEPWIKFGFTLLKDDSGVFGNCPAQHPQRPSDLPTPMEVERDAANGFPVKPPKWVLDKGIKANADRHSNPIAVQKTDDSDSDLDAFLAAIAAEKSVSADGAKLISPAVAAANSVSASNEQTPSVEDRVIIPKSTRITLPKFEDPFTTCLITQPAISPYGHVCEYDSWFKVLSTPGCEDICPFTKKALKGGDLVVLTPDNITKYMQKIVNQAAALRDWSNPNSDVDLQQDTLLKRGVPMNLDRFTPRKHKRSKTQDL